MVHDNTASCVHPARPALFVGRDRETEFLLEIVGTRPVTYLHGPGGVGKTALASTVVETIESRELLRVLWIKCREGWTVDSCLLVVGRCFEAAGLAGAERLLSNPEVAPAVRARGLVDLLSKESVLLVVDDFHELEQSFFLPFLSYADENLSPGRILLISRYEPPETSSLGVLPLCGLKAFEPASLGFPVGLSPEMLDRLRKAVAGRPLALLLAALLIRCGAKSGALLIKELERADFEPEPWLLDQACNSLSAVEKSLLSHLSLFRIPVPRGALSFANGENASQETAVPVASGDGTDPDTDDCMATGLEDPVEHLVELGFAIDTPDGLDMHPLLRELFRLKVSDKRATHLKCLSFCLAVADRRTGPSLQPSEVTPPLQQLEPGSAGIFDSQPSEAARPQPRPHTQTQLIPPSAGTLTSRQPDQSRADWYIEAFHHAFSAGVKKACLEILDRSAGLLERLGMVGNLLAMINDCVNAGFDLPLRTYLRRSRLLRRLGRLDEAGVELERLQKLHPCAEDRAELLWQKGQLHQDRNDYDLALGCYYKALEHARTAGDRCAASRILNCIATVLKDRGEYERARSFYLQSLGEAQEGGSTVERLFAIHNLGRIHYFKGELGKALELFGKVVEEADKNRVRDAKALAENAIGEVRKEQGDLKGAAERYERNINYYSQTGNRFGLAFSLSNIAEIETLCGRLDRARAKYEEAMAIFRSLDNVYGEAATVLRLGGLYRILGDFQQAQACFSKSHELMKRIGNRQGLSSVLACEAALAFEQGRCTQSSRMLEESLELREKLGEKSAVARVLVHKARLHRERGEFNTSAELLKRARSIVRELGDRMGDALVCAAMGRLLCDRGRYGEARPLFAQAIEVLEASGDDAAVSAVVLDLALLYRRRGDYRRALTYYEQALSARQRIGDVIGQADALEGIALIKCDQGFYGEAEELLERSLAFRKRLESGLGRARSLNNLAFLKTQRGSVHEARGLLELSLEILTAYDNKREIQKTIGCLATIHRNLGDYKEASFLVEEAYRCARQLSDRRGMAISLQQSASLLFQQGFVDRACVMFESSLAIKRELDDSRGVVATLLPLAETCIFCKDFERANELLQEALDISREQGYDREVVIAELGLAELLLRKGDSAGAATAAENVRDRIKAIDVPECSARLSRLWGIIAASEGRNEDARYLLQYARDLYGELCRSFEAENLEREIDDLFRDRLLARLDRRTRILEDLRHVEAEMPSVKPVFGYIIAFKSEPLLDEARVIEFRQDSLWFGRRGNAWLFEFDRPSLALDALRSLSSSSSDLRLAAHAGLIEHYEAEPFGPVTTLPLRLLGMAGKQEIFATGPFMDALGDCAPEMTETLPPIEVREQQEKMELYRLSV